MDQSHLIKLVAANPINRVILDRMATLALPDAWLVSGAVFQTIWNGLTNRASTYGIEDYDIFYFDNSDRSWSAEDRAIARVRDAFQDIWAKVEVRNQARVHLWYERKFGTSYPPLRSALDSLDRFLAPTCMIGIRPERNVGIRMYTPRGYHDILKMIVRPNDCANFSAKRYDEKAQRWKRMWPELTIFPANAA